MSYRVLPFRLLPSRFWRPIYLYLYGEFRWHAVTINLLIYTAQSTAFFTYLKRNLNICLTEDIKTKTYFTASPGQGTFRPYDNEKMDRVLRSQCALHIDSTKHPITGCLLF